MTRHQITVAVLASLRAAFFCLAFSACAAYVAAQGWPPYSQWITLDGFETGDTGGWSEVVP